MQLAEAGGPVHHLVREHPVRSPRRPSRRSPSWRLWSRSRSRSPSRPLKSWNAGRNVVDNQWRMKLERASIEVDLAQRRYENVDPANRLVAATLERRWNDALARADEIRSEFDAHQADETGCHDRRTEERSPVARERPSLSLGISPPPRTRTASASSDSLSRTSPSRSFRAKKVVLHLRWQGGACEDIPVTLPPSYCDQIRYRKQIVDRVRVLAQELAGQRGRRRIE